MPLTPDAKKLLAETIRGTAQDPEKGIRERLLRAIHDEADRRYRLSVPIGAAGLDEIHRRRRERIEAWIDERARATKPKNKTELKATKDRLLAQAEKEAAATLVNRLVLLHHLEALGLSKPAIVTGGWSSKGYREFREFAPTLCTNGTTDATEGYSTLLQLLFDELAVDLPGLFGDVGLTRLFAIPAATLREVVERLDDQALVSAWTDDTTLGWVYQYWNDPDREALDTKISEGGKIEPHEIASKTQMFTERYMVEWLLQNSLGLTWLAMCKKRGWTADAERVLPVLEARRADWRKKREAGEVALDALMPIEGELEEHWKYYVPQPIPEDAVAKAPQSARAIKILDPACGSGHFLVIASGLLTALYREEAKHLGTTISEREIAESILENNLYGIDIDPRAIQIAAAGLYLKAKALAKTARPKKLNLVAPVLQLGNLPADDPAVVNLRRALWKECGIPEEATARLLQALAGVDYLGSLLKVDATVDEALREAEKFQKSLVQQDMFDDGRRHTSISFVGVRQTILDKLEQFLAKHSKSEDLGLRLDGEQLAAGVRFVRMAKEGTYDLVVGNPPYQGITKTNSFGYVATTYPMSKADLYAAFMERSLEYAKPGGASALVTMRGWTFLSQFTDLRKHLLGTMALRSLGDLGTGAFSSRSMDDVISTALVVVLRSPPDGRASAIQAGPVADLRRDAGKPVRRHAALLSHAGRYDFNPRGFEVIEGEPLVYWWPSSVLNLFSTNPMLGAHVPICAGASTGNNARFLRRPWEVARHKLRAERCGEPTPLAALATGWVPYIKGSAGLAWQEPLLFLADWENNALAIKVDVENRFGPGGVRWKICNSEYYFLPGVAFTSIGSHFSARAHRFRSAIDNMGLSAYSDQPHAICCFLNSSLARGVLAGLNPGLHFQVADVKRLPWSEVRDSRAICDLVETEFTTHERQRETSIEFRRPGPSPWRNVQVWAQQAVDRAEAVPLPPYERVLDAASEASFVSFAFGVAVGRFGHGGHGLLDVAPKDTVPNGICFLSAEGADSLETPASAPVHGEWVEHGAAVGEGDDLRTYLRKAFFDAHKKLYDNRPIYIPLSSAKKNFVAFILIHRWADDTLSVLLADHLVPTKRRLDGELEDLRTARASANNKSKAEKRFTEVQKLLEELNGFIAKITEIAEKGPPPSDDKTRSREVDARYVMDLDDGVMVNSAALWPLLEPQWKDPKKWWKELANGQGKKDYDWSHLAARYFPTRVRKKCHEDPSLAVAHGCFWELHPAKAYAWELRLQDEIRPDFTIDEPGSDAARTKYLKEHGHEAQEILAKEMKRREKKSAKTDDDVQTSFDTDEPEEPTDG